MGERCEVKRERDGHVMKGKIWLKRGEHQASVPRVSMSWGSGSPRKK